MNHPPPDPRVRYDVGGWISGPCLDAPLSPEAEELAAIRRDFPEWELGFDSDARVWTAISRPAQTSEHFIAASTLEQLRTKLEAAR